MKVQILTPAGPVFEGEATGIKLPGTEGGFEVLQGHAQLVSLLEIGKIVAKTPDEKVLVFAISEGFVEVKDNIVTVMVEDAVSREKIDLPEEMHLKKEMEETLRTLKIDTAEHVRRETELRKITNRINIAQN